MNLSMWLNSLAQAIQSIMASPLSSFSNHFQYFPLTVLATMVLTALGVCIVGLVTFCRSTKGKATPRKKLPIRRTAPPVVVDSNIFVKPNRADRRGFRLAILIPLVGIAYLVGASFFYQTEFILHPRPAPFVLSTESLLHEYMQLPHSIWEQCNSFTAHSFDNTAPHSPDRIFAEAVSATRAVFDSQIEQRKVRTTGGDAGTSTRDIKVSLQRIQWAAKALRGWHGISQILGTDMWSILDTSLDDLDKVTASSGSFFTRLGASSAIPARGAKIANSLKASKFVTTNILYGSASPRYGLIGLKLTLEQAQTESLDFKNLLLESTHSVWGRSVAKGGGISRRLDKETQARHREIMDIWLHRLDILSEFSDFLGQLATGVNRLINQFEAVRSEIPHWEDELEWWKTSHPNLWEETNMARFQAARSWLVLMSDHEWEAVCQAHWDSGCDPHAISGTRSSSGKESSLAALRLRRVHAVRYELPGDDLNHVATGAKQLARSEKRRVAEKQKEEYEAMEAWRRKSKSVGWRLYFGAS
jgi:hypothetical protein